MALQYKDMEDGKDVPYKTLYSYKPHFFVPYADDNTCHFHPNYNFEFLRKPAMLLLTTWLCHGYVMVI